jgi:hypothetical protein
VNTEYNQISAVLEALTGKGDVADASTGLSPFPGNINQLVMEMTSYNEVLDATSGVMEEFVNPKYTDSTKTKFKKPTRLECMMQVRWWCWWCWVVVVVLLLLLLPEKDSMRKFIFNDFTRPYG